MKAKWGDKETCPLCHGTGYEIVEIKGYNYARKCDYDPQPRLPLDLEEETEEREAA